MRKWLALVVLVVGCGGGDDSNGPGDTQFQGTWAGPYTNTNNPGQTAEGVLQLTQDGDQVTGTFTTNVGRAATVTGQIEGERLEAEFTYTDGCDGSAEATADLVDEEVPPRLAGNYTSSDCVGDTSGGFNLTKQ